MSTTPARPTTPATAQAATAQPASPLEEIARRELSLIAPLLTDPRASRRLEELADAGALDPTRARLAQQLVDESEPITLYLPLSEHASERIRDALVDALVHRYGEENPPPLPWGPDELTALETLARAIADLCEAQQYAAIDWSTRYSAQQQATCSEGVEVTPSAGRADDRDLRHPSTPAATHD